MKKYIFILISILFLTGCSDSINIQTNYSSIKLEITNTMNAGCYEKYDDTYFTHNIQDKHVYILDYENNLEYIKTDNWVGYNVDANQYVSSDLGNSFFDSNELSTKIFEMNYREYLENMLIYLSNSELISNGKDKTFSVDFGNKELIVFDIIKKFGTINYSDQLKTMSTTVEIDNSNVTKILFEISTVSYDGGFNNCYNVEWNLSNFDNSTVNLPSQIK